MFAFIRPVKLLAMQLISELYEDFFINFYITDLEISTNSVKFLPFVA